MNQCLFTLLFIFILFGCNSNVADLNRISTRNPFTTQFGMITKYHGFDNAGDDSCLEVAIDHFENIYCAAATTGSMGGQNTTGTTQPVLIKLNRDGKLLWLRQFTEMSGESFFKSLTIDDKGNIFIIGRTNGFATSHPDLRLDNGSQRNSSDTDQDIMIVSLTPDGQTRWIKQFGTSLSERGHELKFHNGYFYGTISTQGVIGSDPISKTPEINSSSSSDSALFKMDTSGNFIWIRQLGEKATSSKSIYDEVCQHIAFDKNDNIYCAGITLGDLFDLNESSHTLGDIFIWGLDPNGNNILTKQIGQNTAASSPLIQSTLDADNGTSLVSDQNGNLYIAGYTKGDLAETNGGNNDGFILKLDNQGNPLWIKQFGALTTFPGGENSNEDVFVSIQMTNRGSISVVGYSKSNMIETSQGSYDLIFISLSLDGTILAYKQLGEGKADTCSASILDSDDNLYLAGTTFSDLGELNASSSNSDAFILRIKAP